MVSRGTNISTLFETTVRENIVVTETISESKVEMIKNRKILEVIVPKFSTEAVTPEISTEAVTPVFGTQNI
jgi:gamma-glutamyl phosphate reductase